MVLSAENWLNSIDGNLEVVMFFVGFFFSVVHVEKCHKLIFKGKNFPIFSQLLLSARIIKTDRYH